MLRAALALLACLMLGACSGWVSDERLFGDGDWAHLDINGRYKNDDSDSAERGILKTLPNGLIEMRSTDKHETNVTRLGLVAIEGGSGAYFLSVDRSSDSDKGDEYLVVYIPDGKLLWFYLPDCNATPDIEGMIRVRADRWGKEETEAVADDAPLTAEPLAPPGDAGATSGDTDDSKVCKFSTKDALMTAGLEAERFLSARHIVAITPVMSLSPDDEADKPVASKRATRRPRLRRSRR